MNTAAKKRNSLASSVIASMVVLLSALLFTAAASASNVSASSTTPASNASAVGSKTRVEIFLGVPSKSVEPLAASPINATRYYDVLEGVVLECLVAPNTGAVLVDAGNAIRKVRFSDGIRHAIKKHVSGNGSISLKTLDPGGNIDKWTAHIAKTATSGGGNVRTVATGEVMEIIAPMAREGGGTLNIGVRLFGATGDDVWQLTTILTRQ